MKRHTRIGAVFEAVSCRTGPLRVGRSLRDLYTPSVDAPVGRGEISCADQREDFLHLDLPGQVKKACKRPPHAQWARPAGHHYFAGGAVRAARSGVGRTAVLRWPAGSTERTAK